MSTDVEELVERLRARAFRLAARDFNGDGASLAKEAASALEAQAEEIARLNNLVPSLGVTTRMIRAQHRTEAMERERDALKAENGRLLLIIRGANNIISDELDVLVQSHTINGDMRLDLPDDSAAALAIGKMSAWLSEVFLLTHSGPADANPTQGGE